MTETVIPYAVAPQRASTTALYDKQWEAYVRFCRSRNIHPLDSTESTVAEYLISMFEGGAQPATIKVHRSSILSVLVHTLPGLQDSLVISNCLRSFDRDRPRQRRVLPKFDINLVLWQLLKPPFTNQDSSSDRDIPLDIFVCKVAFLLALACGSRASEMHAFSRAAGSLTRDRKQGGGTVLSIRTFPGFLAKNDRPDRLRPPVKIPSMFQCVGAREPERFWCPVRAIDVYLARTQGAQYSSQDTRLLRHPDPSMSTTKGHVAYWIRGLLDT